MKLLQISISKVKTYIGFAFKAGKCVMGVDNLEKISKPILILYADTLSCNSVKKINDFAKKYGHQVFEIENFNEISPREGCKALGIKDVNLQSAITKQLNI
ncbi:MAG: hypothetical protein IJ033_00160 [Clostridia bacterium]|nr:hypothetical protein [Clostridia bacterium]